MDSVQPEAPVAEPDEVVETPVSEEPTWNYQVDDTVYLDDTAFRVEQITDREVQLRDPTLAYPIFRAENRENFERMLSQDERNHAVSVWTANTSLVQDSTAKSICGQATAMHRLPRCVSCMK